jgi:hypothetical protein
MATQGEQRRWTVLLASLVVASAATLSAAGQGTAATRTAGHRGADAYDRVAAAVARRTHSSGSHHPTIGHRRVTVINPYALARRFH